MTPEEASSLSIADVIAKLRRAFAAERQRYQGEMLRHDIAHLLAAGKHRDFFKRWPYHFTCTYLLALYHRDN